MKLNGFIIGPEIKKLFKIKVDTPTAGHPVGVEWPNAHHQLASIKQRTSDQQWQSSKKQRGRPQTKFKTSMKHQFTNVHNLGDQHVGNHEMEDAG